MKTTKAIYIRKDSTLLTEEDVIGALFLQDNVADILKPESWVKLNIVEIDIPDSLINDIISANTEKDIDKQVAELESKLFNLLKLRDKGDKNA